MCGISGFSGQFDEILLDKMNNRIAHRGPDDAGTYFNSQSNVGLAHRRLSIIDTSSLGHQPMHLPEAGISIVFNGEIYNYRELKKELEAKGHVFKSHSDTEVLLYAYIQYGVNLLTKLNGMFAFAIWDEKSKQMFVARDGVGIKPFYYSVVDKGVIFSSEIKALLEEKTVSRELDANAIRSYLTYLWSPSPLTILKHVHKLEPGYAMLIKHHQIVKKWQFYDLPYDQKISSLNEDELIEQAYQALDTAVERQLISDVPVGAFLSGGLDSSSIVALASSKLKDQMQCFTIGVNGKGLEQEGATDDLPYAKQVADYLGVKLNVVNIGSEMINHLEKMIYHLDEPLADPAPLNAYFICEMAKQYDVKVLLSGAGGDDIFTGYRRHYALMQEKYWRFLPHAGRKVLSESAKLLPKSVPQLRRISKAFSNAHLDQDRRIVSYFDWLGESNLNDLAGPLLKTNGDYDVYQPLLNSITMLQI